MWDWISGRTSELSAVGLLPAALQGIDIDALLEGARLCDQATRKKEARVNPAALLALMWYYAREPRGEGTWLFFLTRTGYSSFPGISSNWSWNPWGKKRILTEKSSTRGSPSTEQGSTDQHAYVQQLREGINHFFVTFIEVLKDRKGTSIEVEPGVTSGDYLIHFLQGTQEASTRREENP